MANSSQSHSTLCVVGENNCGETTTSPPHSTTQQNVSSAPAPSTQPAQQNTSQQQSLAPTTTGLQQVQQYAQEINAAEAQCTATDNKTISEYTNTVESYAADLYQLEESDSIDWSSLGQSEVNSMIISLNNDIQSAYNGTVVDLNACTPSSPVANPPIYTLPSCSASNGAELQSCASQIYSASGIP